MSTYTATGGRTMRFAVANTTEVIDRHDNDRVVAELADSPDAWRVARRLEDFNRNTVTGMGRKQGRPEGMKAAAVDVAAARLVAGQVR
jgi:hypothetical protein